jgi:hypothetical protein
MELKAFMKILFVPRVTKFFNRSRGVFFKKSTFITPSEYGFQLYTFCDCGIRELQI